MDPAALSPEVVLVGNPHSSDVPEESHMEKKNSNLKEVEAQAENLVTLPNGVRICSGLTCNSSKVLFFFGWMLAVMGK